MVNLEIGARCDEVSAILRKLMLGRVRPRRFRLGHGIRVMDEAPGTNDFRLRLVAQSGGAPPHSKTWPFLAADRHFTFGRPPLLSAAPKRQHKVASHFKRT